MRIERAARTLRLFGASFAILATVLTLRNMAASETESGIEGMVLTSPIHGGPERQGQNNSAPLRNVTFTLRRADTTVGSITTDENGRFRVLLPPGLYSAVTRDGKPGFGACGPFQVEVLSGHICKIEWQCESGMK